MINVGWDFGKKFKEKVWFVLILERWVGFGFERGKENILVEGM